MSDQIQVRPGQIWVDCDHRSRGRQLLILTVDETHAIVQCPPRTGRKTRIRLDRFKPTSTGYELLREAR